MNFLGFFGKNIEESSLFLIKYSVCLVFLSQLIEIYRLAPKFKINIFLIFVPYTKNPNTLKFPYIL